MKSVCLKLEENRRGNRLSVESGNDFLDMTPKVKQKKKKRMLINWTSAKFKVLVKGYKSKKKTHRMEEGICK